MIDVFLYLTVFGELVVTSWEFEHIQWTGNTLKDSVDIKDEKKHGKVGTQYP